MITPVSLLNPPRLDPGTQIQITPPRITQTTTRTRPCPPCRYDEKNIAGKCDAIKEVLDENLGPTYQGQIDLSPCPVEGEDNPQIIRESEAAGIPGISGQINLLLEGLDTLWAFLRCGSESTDSELVIPETWNLKKSVFVGQMVIVTKLVDDSEQPTYRRSFSIPHPRYIRQRDIDARRIRRFKYERGSVQATIQLPDNSNCILNCKNRTEANRVARYVKSLIHPDWSRSAVVKITDKIGMEIQPREVEFHVAKYYPTTDQTLLPDWSLQIP